MKEENNLYHALQLYDINQGNVEQLPAQFTSSIDITVPVKHYKGLQKF